MIVGEKGIILMYQRLSSVLLIILLVAFSASGLQNNWVKIEPLGGGFSVMIPSVPKEQNKIDETYSSHSLSAVTPSTVYIVEYGDYAPSIHLDVPGELAANRDNFVKSVEGKLISSKEINLDGHPGLEFIAENSQASMKSRVYVIGNRVFTLAVAVLNGKSDAENVDRFFGSFAFVKSE